MSNSKKPELVWVVEPENKIRFRYETEGGSHGGLAGKEGKKTYPKLKLINYHGRKKVSVRVSLYTEDKKEHVARFHGKKNEDFRHFIEEKLQEDNTVEFKGLQIICKKKHEIEDILMERKINNLKDGMSSCVRAQFEKKYRKDVKERAKSILNSARLYFVAFETIKPDVPLCTLFSDVIGNQKAASKGDLRISRLSHVAGSWNGGEEVILLCDKVQKENIKIKFYEVDEYGEILWQKYGEFSPADVHYQCAIPFKTPAYQRNEEKQVLICLERNGEVSEPREFTYKSDNMQSPSSKKRKLSNYQSNTPLSPELTESSESVSSMNISSPESDVRVEMPSMSNTNLDDSSQLDSNCEMLFNEETFDELLNFTVNSEDYPLFESIIFGEELDSGLNAHSIPKMKIHNPNLSGVRAEVLGAQAFVGQMGEDVAGIANLLPTMNDYEQNQSLDVFSIDVALRNVSLNDEAKNKSEREFKNCYRNKSNYFKISKVPPQKRKQIIHSLLLKKFEFNSTILHIAVLRSENIVRILKLSSIMKVDLINAQDCKNKTPLHLAVERNNIKAVRVLVQNGGNPNLKDVSGNNCYHTAAKNKFSCALLEINRFSRFEHNVNDFNDEGLTPMHIVIMQNNSEHSFDLLKVHMTDSNVVEKKAGKSLLHYTVYFQPSLLPKLLEMADVDVDIQDFDGNTPLHIACTTQNIAVVKQLLQSRADPLIKNFKKDHNLLDSENSEDDASDGQLPADLTSNTEILKLLRSATETEFTDPIYLENSDYSQELDEIPSHIMDKLCKHLDDEMKWKKLVTFFFDEDFVDSLNLSPSPTKTLLNYLKKKEQDKYLERFKTVLEIVQLTDAVNILNEYL